MTETARAAQAAIQERRDSSHYEVGEPIPCREVGEYTFPEGVEGYSAVTRCRFHDPPHTWTDYALRKRGAGVFQVLLEEDMAALIMHAVILAALGMDDVRENRARLN